MMEQQALRSPFMETTIAVPALLDVLTEPLYFLLNFMQRHHVVPSL